jgi:hypothetical protein
MCGAIYCKRVTRRGALKAAAGFAVAAGVDRVSATEGGAEQLKPNAVGADAALRRLKEGNARYVANKPAHRDFSAGRAERTRAQYPIAAAARRTVRMALHSKAWQLARYGRVRTRRPFVPMPRSSHLRPTNPHQ